MRFSSMSMISTNMEKEICRPHYERHLNIASANTQKAMIVDASHTQRISIVIKDIDHT